MEFKTETLNLVFDEVLMWGPRARIPILERVKEHLPDFSVQQHEQLLTECNAASSFIFSLCERVYAGELTELEVKTAMLEKFAWMDVTNFAHAFWQGNYYAWHG